MTRSFQIPKALIWRAYERVRANGGGAGVDGTTIEDFEQKLSKNLYKIWSRMSSGSYFPPAVRCKAIPKRGGGERVLGIPTVADRVAQTAAKMVIEPIVEPIFHEDSFGYRPGRSALDAVALVRRRCWRYDWVVEFDVRKLFDEIDHDLLWRAIRHHIQEPWVLLYLERWLKAPVQEEDGTLRVRDRGTPQGGVVSPVLANLFLHYAFDVWLTREFPETRFCRYADDGVIHCRTLKEAELVYEGLKERLAECGLLLHPEKSGVVYCKDRKRTEDHPQIQFTFLGYTFRPRKSRDRWGRISVNFLPAVSREAMKKMRQTIRSWHIQLRSGTSLEVLSKSFNPALRGWANYYGRFYQSALAPLWWGINRYLARWIQRTHKGFGLLRSIHYLMRLAKRTPRAFVHWELGYWPMTR